MIFFVDEENKLNTKQYSNLNHETLLNLVETSSLINELSKQFFSRFHINDAQFNILMTLNKNYSLEGMTQMDLSKELIIAKSNLVGLIDKLEEKEFLERKINSADRRFNKIILTEKGLDFIKEIKNDYFQEVDSLINNLLETEKKALINSMKKIQQFLKEEKQIN